MRILCALLPHFALKCEAQRHKSIHGPMAIVYPKGSRKLVMDFSPELKGWVPDMPLQQALSLHGDVELLNADEPHYWSVFNSILDTLEKKSPEVEGPELGQAYVGLDGLQLLYPTDALLIQAVHEAIPPDFAARTGIAGNKFLSYLAALRSEPGNYLILPDNASFLSGLSCDVLPVSARSKNKLREFGISTLGQLAAIPPGPVQAQFGREGKRIWELARGHDDTPLYPRYMDEVLEESMNLNSATVSIEAILAAAESLLARVFAADSLKGRGICALDLRTLGLDSEQWQKAIRFKEPAMNVAGAVSRIRHFLEAFPQPGPVDQVGIKVTALGYPRGHQKSLFPDARAKEHMKDAVKQLELQTGSPQVFKIKEIEPWSRIPERRYALRPLNQ